MTNNTEQTTTRLISDVFELKLDFIPAIAKKVPAIWTSHIRDTEWMFIKMKSAGSSAIDISIFETFSVKFSVEKVVDQLSFHSYALFSGLKNGK